jgi:YD repeat-containing protein
MSLRKSDRNLLTLLGENSSLPRSQLQHQLQYKRVSTVSNKIKTLRKAGYIRGPFYHFNLNAVGKNRIYNILAEIRFDPRKYDTVFELITCIDCWEYVFPTIQEDTLFVVFRSNYYAYLARLLSIIKNAGFIEYEVCSSQNRWFVQNPNFFGIIFPPVSNITKDITIDLAYPKKIHDVEWRFIDLQVMQYLQAITCNISEIQRIEKREYGRFWRRNQIKYSVEKIINAGIAERKHYNIYPYAWGKNYGFLLLVEGDTADVGCGWSLDFPWLEIEDSEPGEYLHLSGGGQVNTGFQDGIWVDERNGFSMYENGDDTYTRYPKNGVREDYDSEGRLISITDLNGNCITLSYSQYGLSSITDTVGRVLTFSYSGGKLTSISDGIRTTTYTYSGGKLVSVTDPIGRVTSYGYMPGNSFLITSVSYPTGGFSSYEYGVVIPPSAQEPPDQFHAAYPVQESDEGETESKLNTVNSGDTVSWESPRPINEITAAAGRPCILQRDDGSLVMYFKDKYVWEEEVCYWEGKCPDCQYICETITHTEWWIKRSVSTDYYYWSAPENVVQVKSGTGNPVVIEKQDGSFLMFYEDKYVWTEENCYWEGCPWDCQYVCETITHTEYWIYERTSEDGLIWGSPQQIQQTALGVRNIAAIQNQDSTFLLCYTDKIGSQYYIREMTSSDGFPN